MLVLSARAQLAEDALRYSDIGTGSGTRARGLGGAYVALSDDYSGVFWNPAGIARVEALEFSLGLGVVPYSNQATYLGGESIMTNIATRLDAIGLVIPLQIGRGGRLNLAVGYHHTNDFNTAFAFDAFNASSSALNSLINHESTLPYELYLANYDSAGRLYSPVKDRLQQTGSQQEFGGLNSFSIAGAFEASPNFSLGATVNFISGSYDLEQYILESDILNVYNRYDTTNRQLNNVDLRRWSYYHTTNATIRGAGLTLGALGSISDIISLGLVFRTPSVITVSEQSTDSGAVVWDDQSTRTPAAQTYRSEYDVITPFEISGGAAVMLGDAVLSGQADFIDYSQTRFSNSNVGLQGENQRLSKEARPVVSYAFGVEYRIRPIGLAVRGGYNMHPSPYKSDDNSFARKGFSFGTSVLAGPNLVVDVLYERATYTTSHKLYTDSQSTSEKVTSGIISLTLGFRF